LILIVALFVGISWLSARRLTASHPQLIGVSPKDFPYPVESLTLTTRDDQTIAGWFVPADRTAGAIILLHGYGGNRLSMVPRAHYFREQGYAVLLYDARACGESTGECITFGYRERSDLVAAIQFLKGRGFERIACLGVSQGGATILFAAEELDGVSCVICESVYDEMTHAVDRRARRYTGLPGWLVASALVPFAEHRLELTIEDVKPVNYIPSLKCPVLIISGEEDNRTWPEDTQRLYEAAREPRELWMISGAQHEDLFRFPGYSEKVSSFLRRHGLAAAR
jgi:alpha-beta hydrolase superfamily lysophospholipase